MDFCGELVTFGIFSYKTHWLALGGSLALLAA